MDSKYLMSTYNLLIHQPVVTVHFTTQTMSSLFFSAITNIILLFYIILYILYFVYFIFTNETISVRFVHCEPSQNPTPE